MRLTAALAPRVDEWRLPTVTDTGAPRCVANAPGCAPMPGGHAAVIGQLLDTTPQIVGSHAHELTARAVLKANRQFRDLPEPAIDNLASLAIRKSCRRGTRISPRVSRATHCSA